MRLKKRDIPPSSRGALASVSVYCDAESHPKWWLVEIRPVGGGSALDPAIFPTASARPASLMPSNGIGSKGGRSVDRSAPRGGGHETKAYLVDDEPMRPGQDGERRQRWNLRCQQCGDSITCREERLRPVIETLAAHGVAEVSLGGLRVAMGS